MSTTTRVPSWLKLIKDEQTLNDAIEALLRIYRKRDRDRRGVKLDLTFEEFKALIFGQCVYCGGLAANGMISRYKEKQYFFRNTIDRLDSSKGYTKENAASCCFGCNTKKGSHSVLNWLRWIHVVANNTKSWPELASAAFDSGLFVDSEVRHYNIKKWQK